MAQRSPAVTVSAILAAGLGIRTTIAMFSIIDGVLLRQLPFPAPEQLINGVETMPTRNICAPGSAFGTRRSAAYPESGQFCIAQVGIFGLGTEDYICYCSTGSVIFVASAPPR
jgi:hypothetical protein